MVALFKNPQRYTKEGNDIFSTVADCNTWYMDLSDRKADSDFFFLVNIVH